MVADPCNSTLVPGIYGDEEGLLARVQNTVTNRSPADSTCGYMAWCPDYHGGGRGILPSNDEFTSNVFGWCSDDSSKYPDNQTGISSNALNFGCQQQVFGTGSASGNETTEGFPDPAYPLVSSVLVKDARTIGACITTTYTGAQLYSGGQYAFLPALPLKSLCGDDPTTPLSMSVDDMFALSTDKGRLGTEPLELVSRPDASSHIFRNDTDGTFLCPAWGSSSLSTLTQEAKTVEPQWIVFAWRGLPSDQASPMTFDLVKTLEWRAQPGSGFTQVQKRAIHGQTMIHHAVAKLDRHHPSWPTRAGGILKDIVSNPIAKQLFNQAGRRAARKGLQLLELEVGETLPMLAMAA